MTEAVSSIEDARQRLYEVLRQNTPFDRKARTALELGTQCLGVDDGYLARIDGESDYWEAAITTETADGWTPPERELELRETYCREAIEDDTPVVLHDAPGQGWADDPAFEVHGLHTYLGVPLVVDDGTYGTVCFVAKEPRSEPFSDAETRFAEHLTRLLERELERAHVETELSTQTTLATVLNRVLRHNIRNDISVIRGYTELMAEQLDDEPAAEAVLGHIDDLIQLSRKARELEAVITTNSERQYTEIGSLIEGVVDTITKEYPEASISVEYDAEIYVGIFENFEQAVEELIENAVKHSGESPTVTVAIEAVPNAVEVQISDDGPGLPDHEAELLNRGEETPLAHGTGLGLWLAYWIVTSHDGSIDPMVTEDGTTMRVSIPRKPAVDVRQRLTELTRSRDKYRAIFEEASDAMVITEDGGRYVEANESAADLFGVSREALLGQSIADFSPDGFDTESMWQQLRSSDGERGTVRLVRPDGSERVVEYAATPNIVPGEHLSILRDVTDRKEREEKLTALKRRYETLLEAAPDPVFVADTETGNIIEVNEAAEALMGESRDRIVGRHQTTLHPAADEELYRDLFNRVTGKQTTVQTLPDGSRPELVTAENKTVPLEISVNTISLPDGPVTYGVFRDISGRVERGQKSRHKTESAKNRRSGSS
ncbi:PAS domain S-box protein [Natronomonas sp. LN261]|uniref:PAS domain S-box protein n=1 Tax=Natronomonas sp. LN261 TaxID=2750669 RepID=UPI0015EF57B5|nr:PAS domain S-box protein [Natronomonas sp. LN261]